MKSLLLIMGLALLFAAEILRVYFIMPFPGSQHSDTIAGAYWLSRNITWIRILGLVLIAVPVFSIFKKGKLSNKIVLSSFLVVYAIIFSLFNYRFEADRMFYQPKEKLFATTPADTTDKNKLVIGVSINGEAKAYPIQIIGYHHQVRDTIGNTPVMVTYCTVCRTGRVFSPFVHGRPETFRLVGMDHFNAMFEDATTKSWWQQATGRAIAGPLTGVSLPEIASEQVTLAVWMRQHPHSTVLQTDTAFTKNYADLAGYDKGTIPGSLEKRDSGNWKKKSWVIGVRNGHASKAYNWNQLVTATVINDSINDLPVVIALESDTASFHAYSRTVRGTVLHFQKSSSNLLTDDNTRSTWNMDGLCIDGPLKGVALLPVQSYQEFWHSWSTFHPNTLRYN